MAQGMDWLIEKIKNPIQRDAEFYYQRAVEIAIADTRSPRPLPPLPRWPFFQSERVSEGGLVVVDNMSGLVRRRCGISAGQTHHTGSRG